MDDWRDIKNAEGQCPKCGHDLGIEGVCYACMDLPLLKPNYSSLLAFVTEVVQCDSWPNEYIVGFEGGVTDFLYAETDADLFTAVDKMVAEWPCEVVEQASYRVWRRPLT